MLLLPLVALSILPFSQSCAPTDTPDFIDYGTLQTTTTTSPSTTSTSSTSSPTTTSSTSTTSTTPTTSSSTTSTSTTSSPTTTSSTSTTSTTPTTSTSTTSTSTTSSTTTTSSTASTTTTAMCIAGYTLQADGNCYKFVNTAVGQPTAQMACQADGANLAPIRTAQQQSIVEALAGTTTTWIGIIRIVTGTCPGVVDTCFGTIDDNQPLGYDNWAGSQGGGSDSEQCVVINVNMPDGIWDDIPCAGGRAYSYVCMIAPAAG